MKERNHKKTLACLNVSPKLHHKTHVHVGSFLQSCTSMDLCQMIDMKWYIGICPYLFEVIRVHLTRVSIVGTLGVSGLESVHCVVHKRHTIQVFYTILYLSIIDRYHFVL